MDVFELILATATTIRMDGLLCIGVIVVIVVLATSSNKIARRCSRCGEVNREAAVYCAQCGNRLLKR